MGRTKLIKTPEALKALWEAYKKDVNDNPIRVQDYVGKEAVMIYRDKQRPFTMSGFEVYCFDTASDVHHYFDNTDGRYQDYRAICSHIRKEIRNHQIDGGMAGIFNPSITQRLNGLTDKQEIKTDSPSEMRVTIVKGKKR
tara:strand:- start:3601 stop:4020 length:420 start_codon:yes stop_codon:yes gene_type:complete